MEPSCRRLAARLADWPDLEAEERRALRAHGDECVDCRRRLASAEELFGRLREARQHYRGLRYGGSPPAFPEPSLGSPRWLPAVAAVVLVVLVALLVGRDAPDALRHQAENAPVAASPEGAGSSEEGAKPTAVATSEAAGPSGDAVRPGAAVTPGTALAPVRRQLRSVRLRRPVKPTGVGLRPPARPRAPALAPPSPAGPSPTAEPS